MRYLVLLCLVLALPGWAQERLSLQEAYELAEQAYPLTAQGGLLRSASAIRQEQIDKGRLPQISWNAQASLQSEVVSLPFELPVPGGSSLDLPLYRVQTTADLTYNLYDGGRLAAKKEEEQARLAVSEAELRVNMEGLKAQVNQYVFSILLKREQFQIIATSVERLRARITQAEAAIKYGVQLEQELKRLQAEELRLESELQQIEGQIDAVREGLSVLLGRPLQKGTVFQMPEENALIPGAELTRPELELFDLQQAQTVAGLSGIEAAQKPVVGAFVQAGVGTPNPLNFFDDSLSPFAIGGVQFSWNFVDWGKGDRNRQLLQIQREMIGQQRLAFTNRIEQQEVQARTEMATFDALIDRSEEITQIQEEVLQQVEVQLREGTALAADYITQSTAVRQAQLNTRRYRLQRQQLYIQLLTLKGLL